MSQTSHTPGPWRVTNLDTGYRDRDEAWVVAGDFDNPTPVARFAEYSDFDDEECLPDNLTANGNLMAAAPDLLAALTHAVSMVEAHLDRYGVKQGDPALLLSPALDAWRAAIAKAEGREP